MRHSRRALLSILLALPLALASVFWPERSEACDPPIPLDTFLLRADAIVFGTVSELIDSKEPEGFVHLRLRDMNIVATRWSLAGSLQIDVRGALDGHSIVPRRYEQRLVEGGRYLLFLSGGAWGDAPLTRGAPAIFPVGASGAVECAGGQIFGLTSHGLLCSTGSRQVAPALDEGALANQLRRRVARARIQRPDQARTEDTRAASSALLRLPGGRP